MIASSDLFSRRSAHRARRWLAAETIPNLLRHSLEFAGLMIAAVSVHAANKLPDQDHGSDGWQFAITPYLWLPTVGGTLQFSLPGGGADASTGPYNYLQNLKFVFMLQGEARKGDWSIFADAVYLRFGRHESSVNAANGLFGPLNSERSFETSLRGTLIQVGGGRTVIGTSWGNVDAVLGVRYLGIKTTLDAAAMGSLSTRASLSRAVDVTQVQNIVDGFAGVRGRVLITSDGRWYLPFYLDAGAGSSKFTWQALTGVGYSMKWGDLSLTYRYLAFYGSGDQLVQTLRFNGPSVNAMFRF
ncbi:hypothetical protein [Caballeronia sp. ATUFL_M1_KS5A]|uniref:hypothetical protein n=1 Tax=Caballeronia sp. ATUFL_M1_KS5A TaxID=2921778 RepID=UPI0020287348|nr:hypothetical protein [Caballeronia sp. ATUFL_M1_KS5A]